MSGEEALVLVLACALDQDSSLLDAIGVDEFAGRRKGREPEGEAWLLEGRLRNELPWKRRYVCHFRHVGLNEALFALASSAVVHVYSVCWSLCVGERVGSAFAAYVDRGNFAKTCLMTSGTANMSRQSRRLLLLSCVMA